MSAVPGEVEVVVRVAKENLKLLLAKPRSRSELSFEILKLLARLSDLTPDEGPVKDHRTSWRLTVGGSAARADRHRTMNARRSGAVATVQRASAAAAG
jgi:hypothetical protein